MNTNLTPALFRTAPMGLAYLEISTNEQDDCFNCSFTEVNPAFEQITGHNTGSLVKQSFHPDHGSSFEWLRKIGRSFTNNEAVVFEHYFTLTKNYYLINAWQSEANCYVITLNELKTDRHAVNADGTQYLYQDVFWENDLLGIMIADKDGNYVDANREACRMTGYTSEDLKSMKFLEITDPGHVDDARAHFGQISKTGRAYGELAYLTKSGERRWWNVMATRLTDDYFLGLHEDITNRKKAEQALAKNEERFRLIIKNISAIIVAIDQDGVQQFVSPVAEKITGYTAEELTGKPISEVIHPDDMPRVMKAWEEVTRNPSKVVTIQYRHIHKTNGWVFLETVGQSFLNEPAVNAVIAIVHDITDRRQTEEALRLRSVMLDQIKDHVTITDLTGVIMYANNAVFDTMKRTPNEIIGQSTHVYGEDTVRGATQQEIVMKTLQKGDWRGEVVNHSADGKEHIMDCRTRVVYDELGTPIALCGISTDITERKQAEASLKEKELKFRTLFENSSDAIFIMSGDTFIECNSATLEVYGCQFPEQILGKTPFDFSPVHQPNGRDSREYALEIIEAAVSGTPQFFEWIHLKRNGTPFAAEVKLNKLELNGQILLQAIVRDISGRKQAEEALHKEVEVRKILLRLATEIIAVPVDRLAGIVDKNLSLIGEFAGVDRIYAFKHSPTERTTSNIYEWCAEGITPEIDNLQGVPFEMFEDMQQVFQKGGIVNIPCINEMPEDHPLRPAFANQGIQSIVMAPLFYGTDNIGFVGYDAVKAEKSFSDQEISILRLLADIFSNVFVRQNTEAELKKHVDRLQFALKAARQSWFDAIVPTGEVTVGPEHPEMLGYVPEKFESTISNWLENIHPDDRTNVQKMLQQVLRTGDVGEIEYRRRTYANEWKWIYTTGAVAERDAEGKPYRLTGIHMDITGRKQAEEALQTSDDIVRTIPSGLFIYQFESPDKLFLLKGNPAAEKFTGLHLADCKGREFNELWPQARQAGLTHEYIKVMQTGKPFETEDLNYQDNRLSGAFRIRAFKLAGERLAVAFENITERKKAEEELKANQEKLSLMIELAPDAYLQGDKNGNIIGSNYKAFEMFGYSKEELLTKNIKDLFPSEVLDEKPLRYDLINAGVTLINERQIRKTNGELIYTEMNSNAMPDGTYQTFIRDITGRKQAEEALRQASARLSLATKAGGVGVWDWDIVTNTLIWDDQMYTLYGISRNTFGGAYESWRSVVHPEDAERAEQEISQTLSGACDFNTEFRVIWPDGTVHYIRALAMVVRGSDGSPLRMIGTNWDITERKYAEIMIRENERAFAEINDCLINLGTDYNQNINTLTALCGKLLGATSAIYNRLEGDVLYSLGQWDTPPDYKTVDKADGHICYDVIRQANRQVYLVRNLPNTPYFETDSNVKQYNLLTYAGHAVFSSDEPVGSLCVVYQHDTSLSARDTGVLSIIASALAGEEQRYQSTRDIEESNRKYRELSTLMRLMTDNMPDMLWAKDLNKEYIFTNKAICKNLLGAVDTEEPLGKNDMFFAMRQRNSQPDNPQWHTFGEICRDSDSITLEELKPMQFDEFGNVKGNFVFLDVHKAPLYDEQGQLIGVVGSARDITERKALEEKLIQQTKLRELLMEISSGFINIPLDKVEGSVKEALSKMGMFVNADRAYTFDYDWEKDVCNNIFEWCEEGISPEINNLQQVPLAMMQDWVDAHKKGEPMYVPDVFSLPRGAVREILEPQGIKSVLSVPMMNENQCIGFVGFDSVRDHHNYSQTEMHLLRLFAQSLTNVKLRQAMEGQLIHQTQLRELLMEISSGFINIPLDKVEGSVNEALAKMGQFVHADRSYTFDYDWEKEVCHNTYEWCNKGVNPQIQFLQNIPLTIMIDAVEEHKMGKTVCIPNVSAMPQGSAKELIESQGVLSFIMVPMMDQNECIGFVGFDSVKELRDYSPAEIQLLEVFAQLLTNVKLRKNMVVQLVIAKEKAEESDRLKSAFLANMSHEIRTPMNGILGFADLLKEPGLGGDEQQKYISIIEKSGNRMLNIINDIIDISKIEAGLMKFHFTETNVTEQLEYIHTFFKPEATAKRLSLSIKNSLTRGESFITTDREKLYAILTNLVKNAIKYTEKGDIEIGCNHTDHFITFYVKDSGIGIPDNRQKAVFERFIQADIEDKMAREGAGLGLAITKAYVEMLGGKLWLESKEGVGSVFYFTLPYAAKVEEKPVIQNNQAIANDVPINHQFKILIVEDDAISELLLDKNLKKIANEILKAYNGLQAVEMVRANPDVDVVLMDIRLPQLDGYGATRQIRQFNKEVVIIALTAYGLAGDREKAIEAGCNDYMAKPYKIDELYKKIVNFF